MLGGLQTDTRPAYTSSRDTCGTFSYALFEKNGNKNDDPPSFVSNAAQNIDVNPQTDAGLGTYTMVLVVSYTEWPDVTYEDEFTVVVSECEITTLSVTQSIANYAYTVGEATQSYPF